MSYHSQGLSRGLEMLQLLGKAAEPLTLAQISRSLELPKSTLLRLLAVMEEKGFVRRFGDPPAYSIGHAMDVITEGYRPPSVAEVAAPILKKLSDEVGFTTNLGILEGRSVLHLHVAEPERALRFATGGTLDFAYCTGLGKMLLSTVPPEKVADHLPDAEPYTQWSATTLITRAQIDVAMNHIREVGFSIDNEERNLGVTCMAVLVPTGGQPQVALSVSGPSGELKPTNQQRILPILRSAAALVAAAPGLAGALSSLKGRMAIA